MNLPDGVPDLGRFSSQPPPGRPPTLRPLRVDPQVGVEGKQELGLITHSLKNTITHLLRWVWRGSKNWGWGERDYEGMIDEMKIFYQEMLFPLEEKYKYHSFHSPALNDADFGAKPLVMLVGQYSTGKTSFIRYLLGQVISSLMNDPAL